MTKSEMQEVIDALHAPFPSSQIEWRVQRVVGTRDGQYKAIVLPYLTARAVMDRLDTVFGPYNWQIQYERWGDNGVKARLGIRFDPNSKPDEWVWKEDGAEETDIESVKGGISSALKRVAVTIGIGRYLYGTGEHWVDIKENGDNFINSKIKKDGKDVWVKGYWDTPSLPDWALPENERGNNAPKSPKTTKAIAPKPAPPQPASADDIKPDPLPDEGPPVTKKRTLMRSSKASSTATESAQPTTQESPSKEDDAAKKRQKMAIMSTINIAARKGVTVDLEQTIQETLGKSCAVDELTTEESKKLLSAIQQKIKEAN